MSTATHLGDRGGQRHVCKQAEAGGACSSEHCSCWSHAELCPSILRGVHPWDPLARPSVHPWWSRGPCAPAPPADVTSAWEGPVATHRRLPGPSPRSALFAHIYIRGRPAPRSSVRCSYPPLVTALLQTVADSVQTCNASFASFSKLASLASFASMQVWRALFWHSSAKFECRFGGFRRFRRFFPKSLRIFDKIWVSSKK